MTESLLLQYCYLCDLGSNEDTFDILQSRVKWNFEAYLEDFRFCKQSSFLHGQENEVFLGSNSDFWCVDENYTWQPAYYQSQSVRKKHIFNLNHSNSEEKWLNWIVNFGVFGGTPQNSPPRMNGSNCSSCFNNGKLEMYQWPWIDNPNITMCFGLNVKEWIVQNPRGYFIPVLSPLGWSRKNQSWRGFGPNQMNLIQILGKPACAEQPMMKMVKNSGGNNIKRSFRALKPIKWKNLDIQ